MRTTVALLGLAATFVTAVPAASPKKFTLSIFSPNNTMTHPDNQTSINGLGLNCPDDGKETFGSLQTVSDLNKKPVQVWLNEKGWLTAAGENGALRYAYLAKYAIDEQPSGDVITFEEPSIAAPLDPLWVEWEITSNDFLAPKGQFKDYPWFFDQNDPNPYNDPHADPHPKNLNFAAPVGLGTWEEAVHIQGVKVHYSD